MLQVGHCIIYLLMPVLQVLAECKKICLLQTDVPGMFPGYIVHVP